MKRYDAILAAVSNTVWLIAPGKMDDICEFLETKAQGLDVSPEAISIIVAARGQGKTLPAAPTMLGVLPIRGVLSHRMGMMDDISGGTSTERIGQEFDAMVRNPDIRAIIMDIDSPGGVYPGTPELADRIRAARGVKPIVAVANSEAASGAYWPASAADEIVVTPSGMVGSIGVLATHDDFSVLNEKRGIKRTYVTYGAHKAEFNPDAPLAAESVSELQRRVDEAGEMFVSALARNRGITREAVLDRFGQGRMFSAGEAVERGMADRVGTFEETLARYSTGGAKPSRKSRAAVERQRLDLLR
jgi:signal peptide peptidase SppA